ncbi:hypothetical protein AKG08_25205 [Achromobacter piechaudii]|nr:hypothetical protein AKG08_25205 [Achromobacter piechaudii]
MTTQATEDARRALIVAARMERDDFDDMMLLWPNREAEVRWLESNRQKLRAFQAFQLAYRAEVPPSKQGR